MASGRAYCFRDGRMADEVLHSAPPAPRGGSPTAPPSWPEPLRALARAATPLLRGEEVRVCLAGPRSAGKSALLREFLPELHRTAAERGHGLPIFFVDGRPLGTAYALLAALVRLAGGEVPVTGWSWERLAEAWRARVPGGAVVAIDHADEAVGIGRLLRLLSPLGLFVAARSGSSLEREWGFPVHISGPAGPPPPPPLPLGEVLGDPPTGVAEAFSRPSIHSLATPPQPPSASPARASDVSHPGPPPHARLLDGSPGQEEGSPFPRGSSAPRIRLLDDAPRLLLALLAGGERPVTTGHLWRTYRRAAPEAGLRPLTLRRVSGLLRELEEAGWVSAPVINRGRGGRTKWAVLTGEARRAMGLEGPGSAENPAGAPEAAR